MQILTQQKRSVSYNSKHSAKAVQSSNSKSNASFEGVSNDEPRIVGGKHQKSRSVANTRNIKVKANNVY